MVGSTVRTGLGAGCGGWVGLGGGSGAAELPVSFVAVVAAAEVVGVAVVLDACAE